MSDTPGPGPAIELTRADLLLLASALDWLTSSQDDESIRLTTGWPAVGLAWLSSTLDEPAEAGGTEPAAPAPTDTAGTAVRAVAEAVREGLVAQEFAPPLACAAGRTVRLCARRPAPGPEPRLAVDVAGGEHPGDETVHVHVRVGVHDPGIEDALAEATDAPAGRTQPFTAETFLLDLVPADPPPAWTRIAPGDQGTAVQALLHDLAGPATEWWQARATRAALADHLATTPHRPLAADRRLAAARALTGDPAGAASALHRHLQTLPALPWPAAHYTAAFLTRLATRFALDLDLPHPPPPTATARTPVTLHVAGRRVTLDAARLLVLVATLGAALDEDDFEFEMLIAGSKPQARELRTRLLSALGPD